MRTATRLLISFMLLAPSAAFAQGNESTSGSATQGSSEQGVLIGAGTTDETTTGSSGPQQEQSHKPAAKSAAASTPGPNGLFCSDIRDATARSRCEHQERKSNP